MRKTQISIGSEHELYKVIGDIQSAHPENRLFLLYGNMGSGKTRFVQYFCKTLNVSNHVSSPSFSLINEYEGENEKIFHIDLYRLTTLEEALNIGIEEYIFTDYYCFIEWPGLIESIVPLKHIKIEFEIIGETSRNVIILG